MSRNAISRSTDQGRSSRGRWVAVLAASGLAFAGLPALPAVAADSALATSFETDQPAPTWASEPEVRGEAPWVDGVTGPASQRIPGDVTDDVTEVRASAENSPNELAANVVDGDVNSKWLAFESTGWVELTLAEPVAVKRYALTSANDAAERDPRDWTLQGSQDGQSWTTLDTQAGQDFSARFEARQFEITNDVAYNRYRLDISAVHGASLLQLAELRLSDGSDAEPPSGPMVVDVGDGPASAYTAKTKVGFTGVASLNYAGRVTGDEGGHAWAKVLDVDVAVTELTQLSYRIFPELTRNDLTYPSTYAAVDLVFTDGTYLSDLAAVDQLGFVLSPRGQGDSKSLYANQWNARSSIIGSVAAGKTVDRVLVGYDNPSGPADFGGWIDDLAIENVEPVAVGRPSDHVVTTRGTNSNRSFSRGNNVPATAVPQGFNFWTPVTNAGTTSWLYEYQKDNDAQNRTRLEAFSASHEASPWMGDRQTFQVMPSLAAGTPDASRSGRSMPFSHDDEVARPHYYSVDFENGLRTEIAPTDHAAMFRFTFPDTEGTGANLIFDNVSNDGGLTIDAAARTITGYSDVRSGMSAGATRMFVYATVDSAVTGSGKLPGGGGENVTGFVALDAGQDRVVTMRIATSLISLDQAKKNLDMEIAADDTFEQVRERAQDLWDDTLDVIEVEGATADQLTTLYSNLYRLYLYPNSGSENTGTKDAPRYQYASPVTPAPGPSTPTQTGAKLVDGQIYVNNGFWDTYRTTWPAYSLFTPELAGELVDGFVQQYRDGGWVSRWSSPGYANLMTGTSSDVSFADAYTKGVPGLDAKDTYDAAVRNATVAPPGGDPNNTDVGRKGLQDSIFLGYTPTTVSEGVSWALEGYINDYGIAQQAEKLAADPATSAADRERYLTEHDYFLNRSQNYVKMFDPEVGFFQGRDKAGEPKSTPEEYDPRVWGHEHDYTETNGWNFAFHVPFDGQGLANLYGGKAGLADKLDTFFATPETAEFVGSYGRVIHEMVEARDVRMGQWGFSNQVSHHIPYMYNYAGQPSKTQEKVREALSRLYSGSEIGQGYAGDEDNGETSAWWLFSALGFYPLQLGDGTYAVGSPLFTKATIDLGDGKEIVVNAENNSKENVYVAGLEIDGKKWDKSFLEHDTLADGAVLDFTMSSEPTRWATGPKSAPPSLTKGDDVPTPLGDLTGQGAGTASGTPGASGLVDDTSGTRSPLVAGAAWQYRFTAPKDEVTQYTLTSGADEGDLTGWVLEGSKDGQKWNEVDRRSQESFAWRLQTRPFDVAEPGQYQHYRLTVEATSSPTASLAEVELIGRAGPILLSTLAPDADEVVAGETLRVQTTLTNSGSSTVSFAEHTLTAPGGWTVKAVDPTTAKRLAAGATFTTRWDVTPPLSSEPGEADLTSSTRYQLKGYAAVVQPRTATLTVRAPAEVTGVALATPLRGGVQTPATVTVVNRRSTEPVEVRVELAVPQGWTTETKTVTVPPSTSTQVTVPVTAPSGVPAEGALPEHTLTATGTATGMTVGGAAAVRTVVVPDGAAAVLALDGGSDTSPVLDGYARLAPGDAWDPATGYGWTTTTQTFRDRGAPDDLRRDFALSREPATLRVHVPAGEHVVSLLRGDNSFSSGHTVVKEGDQVLVREGPTLPSGSYVWEQFTLDGGETGRDVDLQLSNTGGSFWRLVALVMQPAA